MAKYTIISDVGKGLLALLKDKLVPDTVDKGESIGICDPKDRGDYIVGIHPYDIREDTSGKSVESISLPDGSTQDPPAMLELYYVISVNSKAEIGDRALDEAKIIGKIIAYTININNGFKNDHKIPKNDFLYLPRISLRILVRRNS